MRQLEFAGQSTGGERTSHRDDTEDLQESAQILVCGHHLSLGEDSQKDLREQS